MANYDLLLGPILGYEWEAAAGQGWYTVIVRAKGAAPVWVVDGREVAMKPISGVLRDSSRVYRGEIRLTPFANATVSRPMVYSIKRTGRALKNVCGDSKWSFVLPGAVTPENQPSIVFCSCNGFTDPNSLRGLNPLALWERMSALHQKSPISLLLMGGDQLYCDDLARREGSFARLVTWLKPGAKPKSEPSDQEFIDAYFDHYLLAWARIVQGNHEYPHTAMVTMMASIPSVMMWDDHDIFDGWGSYQAAEAKQPYYKAAFNAARLAFEVYQVRGSVQNRSLLDQNGDRPRHYSQGLKFGPYDLLVMDNRTQRKPDRIMDATEWDQTIAWLKTARGGASAEVKSTLLVVSPVPVVYRRFQSWVSELPGEHGGEDDLRDHWSHTLHEGERDRLVFHLFNALKHGANPSGNFDRVVLLSGDVHVGAMGFLQRTDVPAEIGQIVSSAIMHPPPGLLEWEGLKAISSDEDYSIKGQAVIAKMTRPVGAKDRYLRCRNFSWLRGGDDGKLWVNWECENADGKTPERVEFGLR